jgi:hypothetical protein
MCQVSQSGFNAFIVAVNTIRVYGCLKCIIDQERLQGSGPQQCQRRTLHGSHHDGAKQRWRGQDEVTTSWDSFRDGDRFLGVVTLDGYPTKTFHRRKHSLEVSSPNADVESNRLNPASTAGRAALQPERHIQRPAREFELLKSSPLWTHLIGG